MVINKCLVAIKKVINPYVPIKVKEDFSQVITTNVRMSMNLFDEIALEEVRKLKRQGWLQEIIAVSIGNNNQDILIQAMAMGADRAIWVKTEHNLTPLNIAKILKYFVVENQINVAILGKQAIDDDSTQTGQMLAGLLNWSQACFVSKIMTHQDQIIVDREIDNGTEQLQITLPTVITIIDQKIDQSIHESTYTSITSLMQAKNKPIDIVELDDLVQKVTNLNLDRLQVLKTCLTPKRAVGTRLSSVTELIDKLTKEQKVLMNGY